LKAKIGIVLNAGKAMKRRDFVILLGGAVARPLAARPQPRERRRRVGVLMNLAADDPESQVRIAAFSQGLAELGWTIGRNVDVDYRWAAGEADRFQRFAAELLALAPNVILASGGASGENAWHRGATNLLARADEGFE
jgi:putative ABC transport system substrate-binding protein